MGLGERAVRGGRLLVVADADALARQAEEALVSASAEAVQASGRFAVALAGGATPRALYERLARDASRRDAPDWGRIHVFWGDERCVPPEHPDSNYGMATAALLAKVPVPASHVHRMQGEEPDPDRAAARYEAELRAVLSGSAPDAPPRLDLVLLGLGADAHTASLFPGSPLLRETSRLVAATYVAELAAHRLTMTPPLINAAARILFLVSGETKAAALRDVLEEEERPELRPAQCVRPVRGTVLWIADAAAASFLKS